MAKALKDAGSQGIITGRDQAKLEATGLDFKDADVTKPSDIASLYDDIASKHGGTNILVNKAGIFKQIDFRQDVPLDIEEQFKEIDTNHQAPIRVTQTFLSQLKRKPKAALVHVSSSLAFFPLAVARVYCGT